MKNVLITGGSGLIGHALIHFFNSRGWKVSILSRLAHTMYHAKVYCWDIEQQDIDERAFENCDLLIHLAGAGVADKRWTAERRKEILESRIQPTQLLYKHVSRLKKKPPHIICMSGTNYYGDQTQAGCLFDESSPKGTGFLADVTEAWENESRAFENLENVQLTIFRAGAVFARNGGALEKMTKPVRMGLGASLGSGQQWVPWIHIEDLTRLFYWAEKHGKTGIFNAVAPERITNRQLTQAIARVLKKPLRLPNVPAFVLKAALGKLSVLALEGNAVSSQLLQQEGFHFRYPKIDEALRNLIDK